MKFMESLARFQHRYAVAIFIVTLLFTSFIALGVSNIHLQTDINKELPQDLDVIKLQNRISDTFGGSDTVMVLVKLDTTCDIKSAPQDIREPGIIKMLSGIENSIKQEPSVSSVQSAATFFGSPDNVPGNTELVKKIFSKIPDSGMFFNRDYSATMMIVSADLGGSEDKINSFVSRIRKDIEGVEKPACTDITITGNPPIRAVLLEMLQHDMVYTMALAAAIILVLLVILKKSLTRGMLVFTPLFLGLSWTLGIMGWLDIPLSIATVGVGAMILGLGTEYGIFLVERYEEEREKGKSREDSLVTALPSVGSGIIGSGTTTIVGFLALVLATMPMIQHLGETLALGIFCILFSTIAIGPALIVVEEKAINRIRRVVGYESG